VLPSTLPHPPRPPPFPYTTLFRSERAQAAVKRAEAEPIPNVTVYAGFIRQFENRSYDGAAGLSMPVPVWNRNQGNVRAARAELRSEEHTSELQSQSNLVCRLLLEK